MRVYANISAVQRELAATGIDKARRNNQGGGYNFRGIDDVYNALSPIMAKVGLCILPRILSREITERSSKSGGTLFYVVVEAEFDFVSAEDGSRHTVRTYGEAMDSGDKATNKAMSAAYKYAAFMAFAIPTEGDNDADASTHQVEPQRQAPPDDGSKDAKAQVVSVADDIINHYDDGELVTAAPRAIAKVCSHPATKAAESVLLALIAQRQLGDEWKPPQDVFEAVQKMHAAVKKRAANA